MSKTFNLDEAEDKRAVVFLKRHKHPRQDKGAIGGHITYSFTPTGLGNITVIRCGACGVIKALTDFSAW